MSKTVDNDASQANESEGFYSRWSKCKLQSKNNHHAENHTPATDTLSVEMSVNKTKSPELNQETIVLCDQDMPDLDSLDEDSDYSGFLSPGVSDKLRKLALHKLFHGESFNLCDGLDDYDEEFTSFEKLGDIVTADMRFQLEEEAKRKLQVAAEGGDTSDENDDLTLQDAVCPEGEINELIDVEQVDETAEQEEHQLHNNENLS
ncbi:MAG: DUF3306 domain-containing protein [gamma proteobacterium symbiont of Lucinoma myriamae]|nr:DUF3306 domain-containing protein [gamma proteobacterium symbiont of Lucinoma myriamae]MCU7818363.1 DUF3306 domain-containing protein [gamma proteobacterium symbiont of Lucinoma myriamae]MCU7832466.1 DUF3306 domain-containing protein [gamma proteobacterium symbiont of Lucinoma myriamae]